MLRAILKSKIHRARVTEADIDYMGSITIDEVLLEVADIYPYERVQVVDVTNGARLETYVLPGEKESGTVCLNGAAARLIHPGDIVIILSYAYVEEAKLNQFKPKLILVDENNRLVKVEEYRKIKDSC
jgi:aspartate 1-decarboxylase